MEASRSVRREADKGDAVRTILSEMKPDTPAAYLGDDATDEHAFQADEWPGPEHIGASALAIDGRTVVAHPAGRSPQPADSGGSRLASSEIHVAMTRPWR